MSGYSAGSWPRDIKQACNFKSNSKPRSVTTGSDPYLALVMQCKEDAKDPKTAYIKQVRCAPEPIVILATDEQMDCMVKFCTNSAHFGVFGVDPTFDLGSFSVTTTTYEHLHLISRRGGVHTVMIGPLMIHQKKEMATYRVLVDHSLNSRLELRNMHVRSYEICMFSEQMVNWPCLHHFWKSVPISSIYSVLFTCQPPEVSWGR